MIYPIPDWEGRYKCIAQMADGAIFVGCVRPGASGMLPAPLLRVTGYNLSTVAALGAVTLQELTNVEVEVVEAPAGVGTVDAVAALDHAGWALALRTAGTWTVPAEVPENWFNWRGTSLPVPPGATGGSTWTILELQVWRYDGGTWTLKASGTDIAVTGQPEGDYRLICVGNEVWVLGRQSYYALRGSSLVSYRRADLPALITEFLSTSYDTLGGVLQPTCDRWRGRWHGYRYDLWSEIIVRNDGGVLTTLATLSSKSPCLPAFVTQETGLHVLSTDEKYPYGTDWWHWDGRTLRHAVLPATTYFYAAEGDGVSWLLGRGPAEDLNSRRIFTICRGGLRLTELTVRSHLRRRGPTLTSIQIASSTGAGTERPKITSLTVATVTKAGTDRPKVEIVRVASRCVQRPCLTTIRVGTTTPKSRPKLTQIRVSSATGAGTERPKVTGVTVGSAAWLGTDRPTLTGLAIRTWQGLAKVKVQRLKVQALGGPHPREDEAVLFFTSTDARKAYAVRVMVGGQLGDMRAIVRADDAGADPFDWTTYREVGFGRNHYLENPAQQVRVGIIGPAEAPWPKVDTVYLREGDEE